MSNITKNLVADQKINEAVAAFQGAASGGINVMQLAMNPSGAMSQFGGPLMQLVEGLQEKNQVVTELLHEVDNLKREIGAMSYGE